MDTLVTKLKGTVNNPSMLRFNSLKLENLSDDDYRFVSIFLSSAVPLNFKSTGGCKMYNLSKTGPFGGTDYYEADIITTNPQFNMKDKGYCFISPKQSLTGTLNIGANTALYLEGIEYTNITNIQAANATFIGNPLVLAEMPLTALRLNNATIDAFDVKEFGKTTTLTQFILAGNTYGKLEEFIEAQLENGRTSGDISITNSVCQVTLNDETGKIVGLTITFDSATTATVKNNSSVTIASYNANSTPKWTYPA